MSVLDAKKFILKCRSDPFFRRQVYKCGSKQEVLCAAQKAGIEFSGTDVARAFSELQTQAQDEDELDEIAELKMWYEMQTGEEETAVSSSPVCISYHILSSAISSSSSSSCACVCNSEKARATSVPENSIPAFWAAHSTSCFDPHLYTCRRKKGSLLHLRMNFFASSTLIKISCVVNAAACISKHAVL